MVARTLSGNAERRSIPLMLYRLFEEGDRQNVRLPSGTGHITADGALCVHLAREMGVSPDLLFEVFEGVAVRETRAIFLDALIKPEEDRIRYLRNWRRKWDLRQAKRSQREHAEREAS